MWYDHENIKKDIRFVRLTQIALSFYDTVEFDDIVKTIVELSELYYKSFQPYNDYTRKKVSWALRVLRSQNKAKKIKRGVWQLTRSGLIDLAKYHINVYQIPEEIISEKLYGVILELLEQEEY